MAEKRIVSTIGRMVPDGWYLTSDAARMVGKHPDTLRRWRKEGIFIPSGEMKAGALTTNLYSEEDIAKMKKLVATLRPGKKAPRVA
jgi:DNA-binding transcriptional MerR regulator